MLGIATVTPCGYYLAYADMNVTIPKRTKDVGDLKIVVNDLPEIATINREVERFKKTMLQNPTQEEEESYRAVAERHFLNGLERAKELLLLSQERKKLK